MGMPNSPFLTAPPRSQFRLTWIGCGVLSFFRLMEVRWPCFSSVTFVRLMGGVRGAEGGGPLQVRTRRGGRGRGRSWLGAGAGPLGIDGGGCGGRAGWGGRRRRGRRTGCGRADLAAIRLHQRVQAAREALAHRRETPNVLQVQLADDDRPLLAEICPIKGEARQLVAARAQAQVAAGNLREAAAVYAGRDDQPLDAAGHPRQVHREARLATGGAGQLHRSLRRRFLVVEDHVAVIRQPARRVQAEHAHVVLVGRTRHPHADLQLQGGRQVGDFHSLTTNQLWHG